MPYVDREPIRRLVLMMLGPHPRALSRRRMARFLRHLADELEQRHIPHGVGGPAGIGLRWTGTDLLIGRALWRAVGEPARVSFIFEGGKTGVLANADGEHRIRVHGRGVPRISCARVAHQGGWEIGWRPRNVQGRVIWFASDAVA